MIAKRCTDIQIAESIHDAQIAWKDVLLAGIPRLFTHRVGPSKNFEHTFEILIMIIDFFTKAHSFVPTLGGTGGDTFVFEGVTVQGNRAEQAADMIEQGFMNLVEWYGGVKQLVLLSPDSSEYITP